MQKKETLSIRTADALRSMIVDNHIYRVGDKLPNENELSSLMGVSRTTLREAIRILVSEGILDVQRGNGTYVSSPLNRWADSNIESMDMSDMQVTLRDLYETRLIFEPEAAALACKRASDAEIENILRLGQEVQRLIVESPTSTERIASECAFHGAIVDACHNEFLSRFMPIISETIEKTFALKINLESIAEDAYKDHIMIMSFLKERDAQALKSAVTIHLHHALIHEDLEIRL